MAIRRSLSRSTRSLSPRTRLAALAVALSVVAQPILAQNEPTGEKGKIADAVRADLSRLVEAQKDYFGKNKAYTADLGALGFKATSGASVAVSYASPRMWQANASHTGLAPYVCFVIVNTPAANTPAEKPFCQDSKRSSSAAALAAAGPAPSSGAGAKPEPAAPPARAEAPKAAAPKTETAKAEPPKTEVAKTETSKPQPANVEPPAPVQKKVAATKTRPSRSEVSTPSRSSNAAPGMPAQGDVEAMARAATRQAMPATPAANAEAVSLKQFMEQLTKIAEGAAAVMRAKPPELARDPYESSGEYAARRADALAAYQRREADYFAKASRTFLVDLPTRDVRYDPDRELLDVSVDPVQLPTLSAFSAGSGVPTLAVNCYTRPIFWCSPDGGMSYEATDLWRVARSKAREMDVLRTPLTMQARFVVGHHDDVRGPALTLVGIELVAKGAALARWPASTAAR